MSKSLGNVIDPIIVISGGKDKKLNPKYGVDGLRLWVSGTNYVNDVTIGPQILGKTALSTFLSMKLKSL